MKKILIIRNDKLGDFMLAFPSFALARQNLPDTEVHALVPEYTRAMAESCPWIDKIILDPGKQAGFRDNLNLLKIIKQEDYDAVITLFSTTRMALITMLAGIPYRLAPATKIAQFFYNNKLVQRRSRSEKPEFAYNMDLVYHFLNKQGITEVQKPGTPYLSFPGNEVVTLRDSFLNQHNLPAGHKMVFLHPGSGGSASNLTPEQFAQLARNLKSTTGHSIVITAGPGEYQTANDVANKLPGIPHVIFESKNGIVDFSKHLQLADLLSAVRQGHYILLAHWILLLLDFIHVVVLQHLYAGKL